jgi:hypothetical protein
MFKKSDHLSGFVSCILIFLGVLNISMALSIRDKILKPKK